MIPARAIGSSIRLPICCARLFSFSVRAGGTRTTLTMVFKLCESAQRKWRRLDGPHQLAEIIKGLKFKDGVKLIERAA